MKTMGEVAGHKRFLVSCLMFYRPWETRGSRVITQNPNKLWNQEDRMSSHPRISLGHYPPVLASPGLTQENLTFTECVSGSRPLSRASEHSYPPSPAQETDLLPFLQCCLLVCVLQRAEHRQQGLKVSLPPFQGRRFLKLSGLPFSPSQFSFQFHCPLASQAAFLSLGALLLTSSSPNLTSLYLSLLPNACMRQGLNQLENWSSSLRFQRPVLPGRFQGPEQSCRTERGRGSRKEVRTKY